GGVVRRGGVGGREFDAAARVELPGVAGRVAFGQRRPTAAGGGGGWGGGGLRGGAAARVGLRGVAGRVAFGQGRPTAAGGGGGCEGGEFDEGRASAAGVAEGGRGEQRQPYRSGRGLADPEWLAALRGLGGGV